MSRERYNGRAPQLRVVPAWTELHRISGTASPYPPNSFNSTGIRALGDPVRGRFEPIDGGYLYVALSLAGAVAERHPLRHPALSIAASNDVLTDPDTFDNVTKVLDEVHHLKYVGSGHTWIP
ncbi:hypothetical protein [Rhodococcus globerulus]|uniref:hypothetical protein n=1 Tax=Rhodococcus globerulus TaxID=33008 RepID=UPI00301B6B24